MSELSRREALRAAAGAVPAFSPQRKNPPNVLVILSDDQGYGDFDWHGNSAIATPNLRKLAGQGVEFTRFSVSPVCAPTRAAFLTGRHAMRGGVHGVTGGRETLRGSAPTLAEVFASAGYACALIGKWHLGEQWPYVPAARGFRHFVGFHTGHWNRYFNSPVATTYGRETQLNGYITDALTTEAIRAIQAVRRDPFFFYLAYNVPHSPFQVPEEDYQRHASKGLPPDLASVYGMVENLDRNIGRLLEALQKQGKLDNTIVAFFCDNGPNTERFNAGLRGRKGSVYEGGIRSPLLLRFPPEIRPGTSDGRICAHVDLFPTLLDLAGVPFQPREPLDGVSLMGPRTNRFLYVHADHQTNPLLPVPGAVWDQRYKLVNQSELYDLQEDPGETTDLAAAQPERVRTMRKAYDDWFAGLSEGFRPGAPPIEIGHPEWPEVELPATRAQFRGGLQFREKFGYANDFAVGESGSLDWRIEVLTPMRYRLVLEYLSEAGGTAQFTGVDAVEIGPSPSSRLKPVSLPDRKPRSPEAPEMQWQEKELAVTELRAGPSVVTLTVRGLMVKSLRILPEGPLRRPRRG
jgi:arylsulfatase A